MFHPAAKLCLIAFIVTLLLACESDDGGNKKINVSDGGNKAPVYTAAILDINTTPEKPWSYTRNQEFKEFNGGVYFIHNDFIHGFELWRTNNATTELVMDINTRGSSYPARLTVFDGWLYFSATHAASGTELWRTNGSVTQLVSDIVPGAASSSPFNLVVFNSWLYFTINDDRDTANIWRTNGTVTEPAGIFIPATGTRTYFSNFAAFGGWLYFNQNSRLKRTNGMQTEAVTETSTQTGIGQVFQYETVGNQLFFMAIDQISQPALWRTDGQITVKIRDLSIGYGTGATIFKFGSEIYFTDKDKQGNKECWRFDGTSVDGTSALLVLSNVSTGLSNLDNFTEFSGNLYFTATDAVSGNELYIHKDTEVSRVSDINTAGSSSPSYLTTNASHLFFVAFDGTRYGVWHTDGAATPTASSSDPVDTTQYSMGIYAVGNGIYIFYDTNTTQQLWTQDSSLHLVADFTVKGTADSNPHDFIAVDNDLYFLANDGGGIEIWRANGANKSRITDINTSDNENDLFLVASYSAYVYFSRNSSVSGKDELWRTNGVATEPVLEKATGNTSFTVRGKRAMVYNNSLYFFGYSVAANDYVLYRTNGSTAEVVTTLNFINPNNASMNMVAMGEWIYFTRSEQDNELWRTNGSAVELVQDINTTAASVPRDLTLAGDWLYFSADDGIKGRALWRTNGGTTTLVYDADGVVFNNPEKLFTAGNSLYFYIASTNTSSFTLWYSNGSTPQPIDLTNASDLRTYSNDLYAFGDYMIITTPFSSWITNGGPPLQMIDGAIDAPGIYKGWAYYGYNGSFYRTNGVVVENLLDDDGGIWTRDTTPAEFNGNLFFSVETGIDGAGVWYTDGTSYQRVEIPNPAGDGAYADSIIPAGNQLYFSGSDALHGNELWALSLQQ